MQLSDLGGLKEVAEELGVSSRTVWHYARKHWDFPKPVHKVAATPLWNLVEVHSWKLKWHKRRGKGGAPKGNHNATGNNQYNHRPLERSRGTSI
jgi:uncharacterized protein YjcR